jgi:hypothetical protein
MENATRFKTQWQLERQVHFVVFFDPPRHDSAETRISNTHIILGFGWVSDGQRIMDPLTMTVQKPRYPTPILSLALDGFMMGR